MVSMSRFPSGRTPPRETARTANSGRALAIAATAICLLSSGCGDADEDKEPVAFGTAEPAATKLPIQASGDEIVNAAQWPSACEFLTDDEITRLLPQADRIERAPQEVTITSVFDDSQRGTAAEGACRYRFTLEDAVTEGLTASIEVTINGIAAPSRIAEHYADERDDDLDTEDRQPADDHGDQLGPQACYTWVEAEVESYVVCRQGPLMFEVSGGGVGTFAGVPTDPDSERDHWRDKVQIPVAQIIATKVP